MYFLEFEFKVEVEKNEAGLDYSIFIIAVVLLVDVLILLFRGSPKGCTKE